MDALPSPLYTSQNCSFAYQLRWGLTIHWRKPQLDTSWTSRLAHDLHQDRIRILSLHWAQSDSLQLALSTPPHLAPKTIVQRVKGRLQYVVRETQPKALRPHYTIRSYGTQNRRIVEAYVAKQSAHHVMASPASQSLFERLTFLDRKIDLSRLRKTGHGCYQANLHIVLVNTERWRNVQRRLLEQTQAVILASCRKHRWQLSRLSLLADHLHLALGCRVDDAPERVALSLMNNIAWIYQMRPILNFGAFLGTFGEYDQRAIAGEPAGPRGGDERGRGSPAF